MRSDRINSMRKVVVSTTLTDPQWANTEVVAGDIVVASATSRARTGGIVQYGFGDVSRPLLEHGLFDELQLWIHPQLVGPSDAADLLYRPGNGGDIRAGGLAGPEQRDHPGDSTARKPDPPGGR